MADSVVSLQGLSHMEFAVKDIQKSLELYESQAFECIGERNEEHRKSKLLAQGDIRIILSSSSREGDAVFEFNKKHGDGVYDVALIVENQEKDLAAAARLGAKVSKKSIQAMGDVIHSFWVFDKTKSIDEFFSENKKKPSLKGKFLQTVDHITINVEKGRLDFWAEFYQRVFGFHEVRHFDIRTAKSGLISRAIRSANGRVTFPINEPTNDKSQIQEFINVFNGPGIQHIAFHVGDIVSTIKDLKGKRFEFLTVPKTYYEMIPSRVPNVRESLKDLEELGVLVDGAEKGYLLQIFSQTLVGPLFFEYIQRKGDNGFGEGNFRALFEAIERDQEQRGVI